MDMANAPDSNHARFWHRIQGQLILVLLVSLIPTLLIMAHIFNEWYKARHESELQFVKKGVTAKKQIEAGIKVIEAGMELSGYFMPGLGGKDLSEDHARESARVLNEINPHFIRLRTLRVPPRVPLFNDLRAGRFEKLSDDETVVEIRLFISSLDGISSRLISDHIMNLLEQVEGTFPDGKEVMLAVIDRYLALPPEGETPVSVGAAGRGLEGSR
jgi:hypothetical protein